MNILYVYADNQQEWNSSQWRCLVPKLAINRHGEHEARMIYIREWIEAGEQANFASNWADVIVVQRLVLANTITTIERWKAEGKVIVGEIDDAFHYIPPYLKAYKMWKEGIATVVDQNGKERIGKMAVLPIEQLVWGMKLTHGITTPSTRLCEDWREYHPHVFLMPNYIDGDVYRPHRGQRVSDDMIIIGWGGSVSHLPSWKDSHLPEALRRICAKNSKVHVVIAGGMRGNREVVEMLNLPGRTLINDWVSHNEWPKVLATFDIGLIPLAGAYDKRRSWVKSLEYTFMGIPWIGTKGPPTEELEACGHTVFNSVNGWERAIQNVLDNLTEEKAKAQKNIEIAEEFAIQKNVPKIVEVYEKIISYTRK